MKRYKGRHAATTILLLLWMSWAISGCQGNKLYHDEINDISANILAPVDQLHRQNTENVSQPQHNQLHTLSVRQAAILAAHHDEKVRAILTELEKAKIDVKDALTHIWPRFELRSQADIPINTDAEERAELTGGAYAKYDLWKAVAVDDEHGLRLALVNKQLEQLKLVLNGLLKNVLHQLAQLAFLDYKITQRSAAVAAAQNGHEIAKGYAQQNEVESGGVYVWKSRIDALTLDVQKSQQERRAIKHSLASMLGLGNAADIQITDMSAVLSAYASLSEKVSPPSEIWSQHSEARLAEIDYIAAAVQVKLVQMESWPRLQTSLGLGKIPLNDGTDTTATLLQLSMNLPLWDLGDNERKAAKAEISKKLARSRLQKKAEDLYNRAEEASFLLQAARQNYQDIDHSYNEMHRQRQTADILLAQNRMNPLEARLVQLNVIEADIMRHEALVKVQEAGGNFAFSLGGDVIQGLVPVLLDNVLRAYSPNGQPSEFSQEEIR